MISRASAQTDQGCADAYTAAVQLNIASAQRPIGRYLRLKRFTPLYIVRHLLYVYFRL